jgi:anti-sigma-K factor RskA
VTADTHEFEFELGAYALGALDADERRAIEAHLGSCRRCQTALAEFRNATVGIGLATDAMEPPPRVKARVLGRVTGDDLPRPVRSPATFVERSPGRRASDLAAQRSGPAVSRSPVWRLAAAAGVVLAVASGAYALMLRGQLSEAQRTMQAALTREASLAGELSAARRDSARLIRIVDVLSAPDLMRVDLRGQAGAPQATGRAFVSRAQGLVFDARQLPAIGSDRVYQVWIIAGGAPVSAGLLTLGPDGIATLTVALPANLAAPSAVAVTVEPAGGSAGPTTAIVLVGETKGI